MSPLENRATTTLAEAMLAGSRVSTKEKAPPVRAGQGPAKWLVKFLNRYG